MPPPRPPPTETQLQQSEEWKQKGNVAFRAKNYTEAFSSYTEAIALNPLSQTLYSNRSAALLSLGRLPLALNDAKRCVELDPKWAKGYRRKASVLDAMKRLREALVVYEEALEATRLDESLSDEVKKKEEAEVMKLMIALNKKLGAKTEHPENLFIPRDQLNSPGALVVREAERRMQAGERMGVWPPVGSCFRRLWIAEMQFHNAYLHLQEFHTRDMQFPGMSRVVPVIMGRLQTLEELTTALIEDIRVGRFDMDALEKLKLCFTLEQQRRNAIGSNLSPAETIAEYARRLTESPDARGPTPFDAGGGSTRAIGWDYVRPALQLTIRSCLMNGFMKTVFDVTRIGNDEFRRCVEIIEGARAQWPDVDGSLRGRTLEETFLRQVKVHLGESLLVRYLRELKVNPNIPAQEKLKLLDEIISIGEWIIHSFENNFHPPEEDKHSAPAGEAGWWGVYYTHYAAPLAKAYTLIGFANLRYGTDIDTVPLDSTETGKRGPIASSPSRLGIAAINYAKAAAWLPPDDPERAHALWFTIFSMVRRGGYYLADFELIRDMAQKCPAFFTPYFPSDTIPDNHCGKHAAGEVVGTTAGGMRDMICSPMVAWPDDVETDMNTLQEVMGPWTREIVNGEGGGLLAMTEVVKGVWKDRKEKWGEKEEFVRDMEVWEGLENDLRENWEAVWNENQEEGHRIFMG